MKKLGTFFSKIKSLCKEYIKTSLKGWLIFLATLGIASAICAMLMRTTTSDVHVPLIFVLAVLIISFAVSVIGLVAGILWIIQRQVRGVTVRLVLFLFSAAAIANILITRVHPVPHGIGLWEILVTGTLFECLLFLLSLIIPMPDHNPRR